MSELTSKPSPVPAFPAASNPSSAKPSCLTAVVVFDIDGVVRDVAGSYLRALADTVEHFTHQAYRPTLAEVDLLKAEGLWNNDWEAAQELIYRHFEAQGQRRSSLNLSYPDLVDFFQGRYRGQNWDGYIQDEPLLLSSAYLNQLTATQIAWGFFSGATRGSATYVLETRLGLQPPVLVAMEDAPGKPDPTGLLEAVRLLTDQYADGEVLPVFYVGDTVADLQTVERARRLQPGRTWVGVGVIPPHVSDRNAYKTRLQEAGAALVVNNVEELTVDAIASLI